MRTIALVCLIFLTACSGSNGIKLVNGGKSDYQIRIPDNPTAQEERAAWFLQSYVKKISGAEIPVVKGLDGLPERVVVIKTDGGVINKDGFSLNTDGNRLTILGGTHKGCIYGVIDILERQLGCRMYTPGFEVVPKHKTIRIPALSVSDQPVNVYRNVFSRFTEDPDFQDWHRADLMFDDFPLGYYVHTMNQFFPPQDYFTTHPEYFALVDGKRIPEQPCLSHPEVLRIMTANLKLAMEAQPDKHIWSVSQNDYNACCQCDKCKEIIAEEGSGSGPVIRFVNEVARMFPDKVISTLAYQFSRSAPLKTRPDENVQIMLCTIEMNRSEPIAEDYRSTSFLKDIVEWGKITKRIYLWDYTVNFAHHVTPFPNMHVLQPNIQLFVKNNVFEHFQQTNADVGHEFSELKFYLLSRLLWNPEVNTDSLTADFMKGYFGPAAPFIQTYLDTLQGEIAKTREDLSIYGHPTAHQYTFLSEGNLKRYFGYFRQAKEAVKDQPAYLLHVKTYELPIQYATMEIGKYQKYSQRGWFVKKDSVYELRTEMKDILEAFNATCKEAGVRTLHEGGPPPETYYQRTLEFCQNK